MNNVNFSSIKDCEYMYNSKLYEFLATNYDISDLARKIAAAKSSKSNMINLKKIASGSIF